MGDIIISGGDIYGDGVNIAARLEQLAEPGGVCISAAAHEQIRGQLDVSFEDLGPQQVKNISRPISAWSWRQRAADPLERLIGMTEREARAPPVRKAARRARRCRRSRCCR